MMPWAMPVISIRVITLASEVDFTMMTISLP